MVVDLDAGAEPPGAGGGVVEVVDLEPHGDAPPRFTGGVARGDRAVVVVDVPGVELEHQPVAVHQALVLGPPVAAGQAEQPLVPSAGRLDVGDGEQGLDENGHGSDVTRAPRRASWTNGSRCRCRGPCRRRWRRRRVGQSPRRHVGTPTPRTLRITGGTGWRARPGPAGRPVRPASLPGSPCHLTTPL